MKQSENPPNPGESSKVRISRELYVQVEECLNLRRAFHLHQDLLTLRAMAQITLEQEGKNHGF